MRSRTIAAIAVGLAMGGCVLGRTHNDVMVFGTTTQLAIDVSAPVQNAGVPAFTIGYKRHEAVWMPLRTSEGTEAGNNDRSFAEAQQTASHMNDCTESFSVMFTNDDDETDFEALNSFCLALVLDPSKYVGVSRGIDDARGGTDLEIDTYSVFASFGARGNVSNDEAGGALAQFFATGIAAQRLGANPAVEGVLRSGSESVGTNTRGVGDAETEVADYVALRRRVEAVRTCLADDSAADDYIELDIFYERDREAFRAKEDNQRADLLLEWGDPATRWAEAVCQFHTTEQGTSNQTSANTTPTTTAPAGAPTELPAP